MFMFYGFHNNRSNELYSLFLIQSFYNFKKPTPDCRLSGFSFFKFYLSGVLVKNDAVGLLETTRGGGGGWRGEESEGSI